MVAVAPFEIIAAPFVLYTGPVGEAFPLVSATPAGNWLKLGTSGDGNYTEAGVIVSHQQTVEKVRVLGGTGPVKSFRTEEDVTVSVNLMDVSLEALKIALNGNTVTTTAAATGVPGTKDIKPYRGLDVEQLALLVRGTFSAYGASFNSQYQIPVCYVSSSQELAFVKGEPAALALEFTLIEDPSAATVADRFGKLVMQNAVPL